MMLSFDSAGGRTLTKNLQLDVEVVSELILLLGHRRLYSFLAWFVVLESQPQPQRLPSLPSSVHTLA